MVADITAMMSNVRLRLTLISVSLDCRTRSWSANDTPEPHMELQ